MGYRHSALSTSREYSELANWRIGSSAHQRVVVSHCFPICVRWVDRKTTFCDSHSIPWRRRRRHWSTICWHCRPATFRFPATSTWNFDELAWKCRRTSRSSTTSESIRHDESFWSANFYCVVVRRPACLRFPVIRIRVTYTIGLYIYYQVILILYSCDKVVRNAVCKETRDKSTTIDKVDCSIII